jgi:putative FmdB family regulatory protein
MPLYEYRCRTCDRRFELQRPMHEAATSAPCPDGHADTVRVLSMFATTGTVAAGGGCCGGSCGCQN